MKSTDLVFLDITSKYPHAQVYLVGGAVRDNIMGFNPQDKDYVVTGLSVEEMNSFGWDGYGESFFVYIHPTTGYEVALPRTEQKIGTGYTGFTVETSASMTIEQDLLRRDLTINAMALNLGTDIVHDPYGGTIDLVNNILRPTSPAFMEDPVRSLRVARFMARYGNWTYHDSVSEYTKIMIDNGEFNTIPSTRIMLEIEKAFDTKAPSLFFDTIKKLGLHDTLFGETTITDGFLIDHYKHYNSNWLTTFLACCHTVDPTLIKKWNIQVGEILSIITDESYRELWFDTINSVVDTVQRLNLFKKTKVLELLTDIWLVRFAYGRKIDATYRHIAEIATISYTDMVQADPSLECSNPKDRSDVLNTYRLSKLRTALSNDSRCNK